MTPAYAGKVSDLLWELLSLWDDPRIRGEGFVLTVVPVWVIGMTPAYAGKVSSALLADY